MNAQRTVCPTLLALLVLGALPLHAQAQAGVQWKWRDANGVMQYTDRPPPVGTPDSAILSRPMANTRAAKAAVAPASAASDVPRASARPAESELDKRKRKAEEDKAAQQKAEEEKQAKVRADNCERARAYERQLKDGVRISRSNAAGEREVLDDQGRAAEMLRTQDAIQSNCR